MVFFSGPEQMIPHYASPRAAGADLKAHIPQELTIAPGERVLIPTGLRMAVPSGWEAQVRPRSGLALKFGITVLNSPGTIDSDYRGEVKVVLINLGRQEAVIAPGDRIAQIVIAPAARAVFERREELSLTDRGSGGFGSTGP